MTETRPRPEYGEYATPEEQAEAMGTVIEPVADIPADIPAELPPPTIARPAAVQARRWDLVVTIALLVFAIYTTINVFVSFTDLASVISRSYVIAYGYKGGYPNADLASSVGRTVNIIQPVLLLLTIWLSTRSLRRGRVTFWIPLAAGGVSLIVTLVALSVLISGDPDFMAFMTKSLGG